MAAPQRPAGRANVGAGGAPAVLRFFNRALNTYRGTTVNRYGDRTDVGQLYLTGVQAALAETSDSSFDQATQRPQIIRVITCRVPNWADIITTDTLEDPATGNFYMIEDIKVLPGPGFYPPLKELTLRARSGVSVATD